MQSKDQVRYLHLKRCRTQELVVDRESGRLAQGMNESSEGFSLCVSMVYSSPQPVSVPWDNEEG